MSIHEVEIELTVERTFYVTVRISPEVPRSWHDPGEPGEAEILEVDFNDGMDLLSPGERAKSSLGIEVLYESEVRQAIEKANQMVEDARRNPEPIDEDDHNHRPF